MSLAAFTTGARDGDARAPGALTHLLRSKKLPLHVASAEQVHNVQVRIVSKLTEPKKFHGADGLLTGKADQPLAIFTADCVPLFLSAKEGEVVGLLHAGWRGVQGRIFKEALTLLRSEWSIRPSDVRVWAGPSIGSCCFEVQWDVARYFPATRRRRGARWVVDLEKELRLQVRALGALWTGKNRRADCTMHQSRFYSYRRDATVKRQVSVIMKRHTP